MAWSKEGHSGSRRGNYLNYILELNITMSLGEAFNEVLLNITVSSLNSLKNI
jgi:hypothetical protein